MNWRWISITALLAALVIGYGALNREERSATQTQIPLLPTYYLRNAVITETSDTGALQTQLAAARIELQPANDDLAMDDVLLTYHQTPQQQWQLTGERGFKAGVSPIFRLTGNVELQPVGSDVQGRLRADELAIDTEKEIAFSTRSPVQISFGQHNMEVRSFTFDLNEQRLNLESGEGRYVRR